MSYISIQKIFNMNDPEKELFKLFTDEIIFEKRIHNNIMYTLPKKYSCNVNRTLYDMAVGIITEYTLTFDKSTVYTIKYNGIKMDLTQLTPYILFNEIDFSNINQWRCYINAPLSSNKVCFLIDIDTYCKYSNKNIIKNNPIAFIDTQYVDINDFDINTIKISDDTKKLLISTFQIFGIDIKSESLKKYYKKLIHINEEKLNSDDVITNNYDIDILYEKIHNLNDDLKEENDNLKEENDDLKEENDNLKEENDNLNDKVKELESDINKLNDHNNKLNNKIQELELNINNIKIKNNDGNYKLTEEINKLKKKKIYMYQVITVLLISIFLQLSCRV